MINNSIAYQPSPDGYLLAQRAKLMAELESIGDLPPEQLHRRYYEIAPELRYVCRLLSQREKSKRKNYSEYIGAKTWI
mgnify:CR=1 FL=1